MRVSVVIVLLPRCPRLRRRRDFDQLADLDAEALADRRAALCELRGVIQVAGADHGEAADALAAVDVAELARGRDRRAGLDDVLADLLEPRVPLLGSIHVQRLVLGLAVGEDVTGHLCLLGGDASRRRFCGYVKADTGALGNWAVWRRPVFERGGVNTCRDPRWKDVTVTELLLDRARAGDEQAFAELTDPLRRELHVHCYRILGSLQDAEDALQETLLAAWRGLDGYERRASLRTWLYRIATNRCLNALRATGRRAPMDVPFGDLPIPEPTRETEIVWLQPYPDVLLEALPDTAPGPEAQFAEHESISLAFITVLQTLPPRQRAALILRDVMGFRAAEVAEMLESTEESVTSALKRARASLSRAPELRESRPLPDSPEERELMRKLTIAYETADVDALVALLTEDVWLRMPPLPLEYRGRELTRQFMSAVPFRPGREFRVLPTRANLQPAFGLYPRDEASGVFRAYGVLVFTLSGDAVSAITFFDSSVLGHFGLPRILPER
ncbi:MAG: sigma-70 family RNA polymerase sigma factor [Acidobacteriota bacterium]|nr:sigma-70 family RNA polymerase sigma factor [Acidobacteriota bacterium]